jgi:hypothetical protein
MVGFRVVNYVILIEGIKSYQMTPVASFSSPRNIFIVRSIVYGNGSQIVCILYSVLITVFHILAFFEFYVWYDFLNSMFNIIDC